LSIVEWEGPDVIEEVVGPVKNRSPSPPPQQVLIMPPESDSGGESVGSGDEYKDQDALVGGKTRPKVRSGASPVL
jgi:hypothetical protein